MCNVPSLISGSNPVQLLQKYGVEATGKTAEELAELSDESEEEEGSDDDVSQQGDDSDEESGEEGGSASEEEGSGSGEECGSEEDEEGSEGGASDGEANGRAPAAPSSEARGITKGERQSEGDEKQLADRRGSHQRASTKQVYDP